MLDICDGLHFGVSFSDYLRWAIYSQSVLKEGRRSMAHLKAAWDKERVKEPTDDMVLGSALHTAFLEPELMLQRVIQWTGAARRGKEWEAFRIANQGRIILTENQHEKLIGMIRSLRKHPEVRRWMGQMQSVEVSAVGTVHGLRMKGRCDALTADPLIDLKKVSDGDPRRFLNTVMDYGYGIQGYIYGQLFERDRFLLLCVEDEPPYDVVPYELSPGMLRAGKREANEIIEQVLECQQTGVWPGRSDTPILLEQPEWAGGENSIEIAGQPAFVE